MVRRALPPQKSSADLSRHYLEIESLTDGWDVQKVFPTVQPLEVELGSGKGLFLNRAARENRNHNYIGLEIRKKYAIYSAIRLERGQLDNAIMMQGDGLLFCSQFLPDQSVTAMHVYFPDPWWKQKHRKRRVLTTGFIADVERVLQPGGKFHFWTDVQEYFDVTLKRLEDFSQLTGPHGVAEREPLFDMDYRTHFERRTRQHQEPVYRSEYVRE